MSQGGPLLEQRRSLWTWSVAVTLVAALVRFSMLSSHSLWIDEDLTLTRIDAPNIETVFGNLNSTPYDKYQPTYFVALFYWLQVFGESVTSIRSLSAAFGTLSVLLTSLTALGLYGRRHAVWTTAMVSLSAFHVYYSQEARAYALVMFVAALQLYFFSKATFPKEKERPFRNGVLFWITTAVGCLSSIFVFLLTTSICLSHLLIKQNMRAWIVFWLPLLVSTLPAISLYMTSPSLTNPSFSFMTWYGTNLIQNFLFVVYGLLVGTTYSVPVEQLRYGQLSLTILEYWPQILLFLLAIGMTVAGLTGVLPKHPSSIQKSDSHRATAFLLAFVSISFLLSACFAALTAINWAPRHSSHIFPAIAILLPSTFCYSSPKSIREELARRVALAGMLLLIALNIYSLSNYFFSSVHARDDYRSAAQYVINQKETASKSVLLWGDPKLLHRYGDTETVKISAKHIAPEALPYVVNYATDNSEEITVLVNREYLVGYPILPALDEQYELRSKTKFAYFDIYELKLK